MKKILTLIFVSLNLCTMETYRHENEPLEDEIMERRTKQLRETVQAICNKERYSGHHPCNLARRLLRDYEKLNKHGIHAFIKQSETACYESNRLYNRQVCDLYKRVAKTFEFLLHEKKNEKGEVKEIEKIKFQKMTELTKEAVENCDPGNQFDLHQKKYEEFYTLRALEETLDNIQPARFKGNLADRLWLSLRRDWYNFKNENQDLERKIELNLTGLGPLWSEPNKKERERLIFDFEPKERESNSEKERESNSSGSGCSCSTFVLVNQIVSERRSCYWPHNEEDEELLNIV